MSQVLYFGKQPAPERLFMNRRPIHVMLAKGMGGKTSMGIYKLIFDDYFYIGRSNNIRKRVKQHTKELELMLAKDNPKSNYQRNMLKFLKDNPEFKIINVEILELCNDSELNKKEQEWLNKYSSNDKCLNLTFKAKETWKDKARHDFKVGIYSVEYKIETYEAFLEFKNIIKHPAVISSSFKENHK